MDNTKTSENKLRINEKITVDYKRNVAFIQSCQVENNTFKCDLYYTFMEGGLSGELFPLNIIDKLKWVRHTKSKGFDSQAKIIGDPFS